MHIRSKIAGGILATTSIVAAGTALATPVTAHNFTRCTFDVVLFEDGTFSARNVKAHRADGSSVIIADRLIAAPAPTRVVTTGSGERVLLTSWTPGLPGSGPNGQGVACTPRVDVTGW